MTRLTVCFITLLLASCAAKGITPGDAPPLPLSGARIVNVGTVAQLQNAVANLQHGDTLLLSNGTYNLSSTLYVNNRHNVTIRGASGSTNVVLVGRGMDNSNFGNVPFGIWSNSTNTTIAHLTIRDTWDNEIIYNPGAQSPHVYSVRLLNAGSQFIKANPTDVAAGLGVNNGIVEYSWFEYTGDPPGNHGGNVGYFNGISAHAAKNWIVRGNLFKNLHNPDGTDYDWNPSILFWNRSTNTITERNTFINVDRAVAYGLNSGSPPDHAGGVIRNNFVWLAPGLLNAGRRASSDGSIIAWNSPGTQVDHNTVMVNSNVFYAVQFRFSTTTGCTARNNLADAPVHLRDSATATLSGNLLTAKIAMFVNPTAADLHLLSAATNAIDKAPTLLSVTNDIDGAPRPVGDSADIGADEFTPNTPPTITAISVTNENVTIQFTTAPGGNYGVFRANSVTGLNWFPVATNIPGNGSNIPVTDTNAANESQRFYRVEQSP